MLKKLKTSIKNNIFKQDIVDQQCCSLNKWKKTFGTTFYERSIDTLNNNHFVKYYTNEHDFACEIILHQYLLKKKITIDFDIDLKNKTLSYIPNNKISLYCYLQTYNDHSMLQVLLNELFAFVYNFKKYNFSHGNLHIANIFINPKTFKVYTIDFTHSHLLPKQCTNSSVQQDLNSLYKSLKKYFTQKRDCKSILYLDSLMSNYLAV